MFSYFVSANQNLTQGYFIRQSITHFMHSIEYFSKQNFKFSQYFQPLNILNKIPDSISDHLNNVDFIYHLDEASKHIDWLNDFFENNINPITKKQLSHLKSSNNKDIQIPYADLKVDEPPLFKNDSVQQLSFEDINRNGTITPVKRRDPDSFNFDGICPYCGDKAKDFISIVENKIKSNKLSSIDETINYLILHQSDEIANLETISTKTFYNYVHQGRTSIKPIDLPRMVRKKTKKNWKTYIPKRKKELPLQKDQIISMKEVNLVIGKVIWLLVPEMDKMELILLY